MGTLEQERDGLAAALNKQSWCERCPPVRNANPAACGGVRRGDFGPWSCHGSSYAGANICPGSWLAAGMWEDASRVLCTWPQTVRVVNAMCYSAEKEWEGRKFKGRSQGYKKMLSGMVILLVGFTKSLLLSYCEELVLPEAGCPCLCQS